MTPFWLVVLLFGKVAAAIGPLPDGAVCDGRLKELSSAFDQRFEADAFAGAKPPRQDGRDVARADFVFECRQAEDPPPREIELR